MNYNELMKESAKDFHSFVKNYGKRLDAVEKGQVTKGKSPADTVSEYLHGGFLTYIRALECLKTCDSNVEADKLAEAMANDFLKLDEVIATGWNRLGRKPRRSFYRTSLIVRSVCKPSAFVKKGTPSVFKDSVSPRVFRRMAVDRSCKAVYSCLAWLRDESCVFDRT